ncbi:MAG TPA: ATP-binding cassette domain-containing protein [Actinomycetota bacterium]|nr:ATP-binding cassette domain-containing protein [Actinomycetota bacterium]
MADVLRVQGAEVRIGGRRILGPLSLCIDPGERWVVLGSNGSGKTTLLRLAGALRQPSAGTVEVLGERLGATDVRALRARIGFVGHAVADELPPGLSVVDAVLTGKRATLVTWMQQLGHADRRRAAVLLEHVGCAQLEGQPFRQCSQGERQRVLLARALFGNPELLLLDEPAAGLDLPGRESLIRALEAADDLGSTPSVLVTHHLEEIPPTTTHAALLRAGEVVVQGPVDEVLLDEPVSACFDLPVRVGRKGSRWSAVSLERPTGHLA